MKVGQANRLQSIHKPEVKVQSLEKVQFNPRGQVSVHVPYGTFNDAASNFQYIASTSRMIGQQLIENDTKGRSNGQT